MQPWWFLLIELIVDYPVHLSRGANVKNLWGGGGVAFLGPTLYKNDFVKA